MPFDNQMVKMELKGSDILELLKIAASRQRGVLQVSGLSYTFRHRSPVDYALVAAKTGETAVDPEKYYSVITNNFLADGGDNFLPFRNGRNLSYGRQQRDVVKDYIAGLSRSGPVSLRIEGRVVAEE